MGLMHGVLAAVTVLQCQPNVVNKHDASEVYTLVRGRAYSELEMLRRSGVSFRYPMSKRDQEFRKDSLTTAINLLMWGDDKYERVEKSIPILLKGGASPNALNGTPLAAAAWYDRKGTVLALLLRNGATKSSINRALIESFTSRLLSNSKSLLARGADPNRRISTREFMWGPWRNPSSFRPDIKSWKVVSPSPSAANGAKMTFLSIAARTGQSEMVSVLLKYGAFKNVQSPITGFTALHEAAHANQASTIKVLLSCKASRNIRDKNGRTPLEVAIKQGAKEAIEALGGKVP